MLHATDLAELPRQYGRQLEIAPRPAASTSPGVHPRRSGGTMIQQRGRTLPAHRSAALPTMPTEPPTYEAWLAEYLDANGPASQPVQPEPGSRRSSHGLLAQALPLSTQIVGRPFDERPCWAPPRKA